MDTRKTTAFGILGVGIGVGIGIGVGTTDRPVAAAPDEVIAFPVAGDVTQEPVLIHDVSGYSLIGPIHFRFTVYNSGLCSIAEQGTLNEDGSAAFTYVTPSEVRELTTALYKAGAFDIDDNAGPVFDVPLTTVTFFARPGTSSRANTFSYYLPNEKQQAVLAVTNGFIDEVFPNFPDGGGTDQ